VASAGEDPTVVLAAEAQRLPQPVARWLATAAASGEALRSGDPKQQVVAAWNAAGGPAAACQAAVAGRYPFVANAEAEISIEDFARLFAPGGVLDGFFNTLARPYVDTKASPWRPAQDGGPIGAGEAAQFQRAAQIRDLFFADGRTVPIVRFDIQPVGLGPRVTRVTMDLDGTVVDFAARDPKRATEITWPMVSTHGARLAFEPAGAAALQENGSWAMFRLFGRGKISPGAAAERSTLAFQQGDRTASFDLRTGARNPFAAGILSAFRCPVIR
jgi:type VI secretion system protein ImpL